MQLGPYEILALNDGTFALDGGAMFGTVPRVLWEKKNPPDEKNRIAMALRTLLVRGNGRTILVDSGIGDKFAEKFVQMYKIDRSGGGVVELLRAHGVSPESVTDVVISHLHFDHAGGATRRAEAGGEPVPTFPEARVHVQAENFETACCPNERERASYLAENCVPLDRAGRLVRHAGPYELAPGIEILTSNGHTRGMQTVLVRVPGEGAVFYPADLIPTSSHLRIPWIMGYDLWPLTIMQEKRELLARAAQERWTLVYEHDPSIPASTVAFDGKDYGIGEPVAVGALA